MYIEDPFDLPEAVVTVSVDGISDIGQQKGHHFPLKTDISEIEVFQSLERRVLEHYPTQSPQIIRIDFSNGLEDVSSFFKIWLVGNYFLKLTDKKISSVCWYSY